MANFSSVSNYIYFLNIFYFIWTTFNIRFYINGKLIGGCDILNEMHKEGTLEKLFEENGLIEKTE